MSQFINYSALINEGVSLRDIPDEHRTVEVCANAISVNHNNINYVPPNINHNDLMVYVKIQELRKMPMEYLVDKYDLIANITRDLKPTGDVEIDNYNRVLTHILFPTRYKLKTWKMLEFHRTVEKCLSCDELTMSTMYGSTQRICGTCYDRIKSRKKTFLTIKPESSVTQDTVTQDTVLSEEYITKTS